MTNNESTIPTPESLLQHASWAHSLARSLVGEAAAEDLVQDTWLAAIKAKPSTDRPLKPWLGTVLGNLSRQSSRGSARRRAREEDAAKRGFEPSAGELTEKAESQKLLMEQLLKLDEDLREVLLLKFFEDLSAAEIGRRKGVPASTIKTRIQRGLDEMRTSLDSHFGGERNSWGLALVPLLRMGQAKRAGAVAAAGGIGLKLAAQILLCILVGAFGVVVLVPLIGNLPFFDEPIPIEEVTFKALEPLESPAVLVTASEALRAPATSTAPAVETPVVSPTSPDATLLKIRFLDEDGNPVVGVHLRSRWGQDVSEDGSDLLGRLEFPFASKYRESNDSVVYFHPGIASDVISFEHLPGGTVNLGDVSVIRGGALSGVVVDGFGEPLVGAQVRVDGAEIVESAGGGLTSHTLSSLGEAEARTNERGEFRLVGLLVGNVRVKVNAKRGLHKAESGWVPIRGGEESQGLVIVAAELPREERLEGYVLGPEGEPVAGASVKARFKTFFSSGSTGTTTDRTGFFRILVRTQTGHDMEFRSPSNHSWTPIFMEDVEPGQVEMRIQFDPVEFFTLRIVDDKGELLSGSTCSVFDGRDERDLQWAYETDGTPGKIQLRINGEPTILRVQASGFREERVYLAKGEVSANSDFTVTLAQLPGVTGRLVQNGEPVADATVYLQRKASGKTKYNGLPVRFAGRSETSTHSNADGTFYLDARKSGEYVVRAVGKGLAPTESALLQLSPESGLADLELELSSGGSIEGALILQGDASPAGKFVAVSRGDCWAETQRVGADGAFRFDNLIPGNWMVKLVNDGIDDRSSSSETTSSFLSRVQIPSNCVVLEGQVTHHDLVPVPLAVCVLRGQLELEDIDMTTWNGSIDPESLEDGSEGGVRPGFLMDKAGNFEIRVKGAGMWKLEFKSPEENGLSVWTSLELTEGVNRWDAALPMGSATLSGSFGEPFLYYWQGPDGLTAGIPVSSYEGNQLEMNPVPAGPAKLILMRDARGFEPGGALPPAWVELDVPAGSNLPVTLPK